MTVKSPTNPAAPTPTPAPAPATQKSGGWGSWGGSLLNTIANVVTTESSPSPEPPIKPRIEEPPRGFTPVQPPKSQPAGFGSSNKPAWGTGGAGNNKAWGAGGAGNNNAWGPAKTGPTPIAQNPSTGPAWGNPKPPGSTFGSGGTGWGTGTGPAFGSGVNKNLTVDTSRKPLESSPNTAGPENIPESAVEIKHVPAPGGFNSSITDKKEETGDAQDNAWGWEEAKTKDPQTDSKVPSPVEEKTPETQAEETEEAVKVEETAAPAEEDEFDWANTTTKKGKKSRVASVAQTPSTPNTPDPDNADDGGAGGGGGGSTAAKKKKKRGKKP